MPQETQPHMNLSITIEFHHRTLIQSHQTRGMFPIFIGNTSKHYSYQLMQCAWHCIKLENPKIQLVTCCNLYYNNIIMPNNGTTY